ncbi:restriction endonuclease subunit S [Cupriavidus sp. NPDC089707]|uniref:restriction endonuclease subunit S n=1 Tax=Cupriavidus sp. NPDC089707 TaxID=3363963 RepID=UPI00380F8312
MSNKTKTSAIKDEATPARVPKLRFPEFREADGWKFIPLNRLAILAKQKNRDEKIVRVLTNSAEFGVVDQRDFFDKDIATQGKLEGYFIVELGSYVYNPRISSTAPVGPISKNKIGTGVMSPLYTVFKFKDDRGDFYEHFFKTTGWHTYMRQASSTGARHDRMAISSDDFMAMPLPAPSSDEQQKIAECLSSVDELIAAQARKVDSLRTHKIGLMQQLFPREGETKPRLRFPEFQRAGEWEMRELSDFVTERNEYSKEKVPLFSLTIEDGVTPKTERYERSFLVNDEAEAYKLVLPNDFALNPMNLRFGAIGRHSGTEKVAVSKYYNIFWCDDTVDSSFCELYFRSERMVAFYDDRAIGSLIEKRRVHFAAFLKFRIRFPRLSEQQRIASCLSSLDALITVEAQKLEALKNHKKALMQQLFPSPEDAKE